MSSRYFVLCPLANSSTIAILLTSFLSSSSAYSAVYPASTIQCIKGILNSAQPNWTHSLHSFFSPNTITLFFSFFSFLVSDTITWLIPEIIILSSLIFLKFPCVIITHILLILSPDIFLIHLLLSLFTVKS